MRQCTSDANFEAWIVKAIFLKVLIGQGMEVRNLCERNGISVVH